MDADPSSEERRSGRPRGPSSASEYAVLTAAWRILTDEGITALTPTRLHDETGVARTTIYRHWPTPSAVVAAIVSSATVRRVARELTGDIRADLLAALGTLTFRLHHRPVKPLVAALLAGEAATSDTGPTAADYVTALLAPLREVIDDGLTRRAIDPGRSLAGRADSADLLLHELVGPMLLDVVLLGGEPEGIDDAVVVDRFLSRYGARSSPRD